MKKKDMAQVLAQALDLLKAVAPKAADKTLLTHLQNLEAEAKEAMGQRKSIGPCLSCKRVEMVRETKYELRKSQWFTCPHGDHFCPDCVRKEYRDVLQKRREAKAVKGGKK